MSHPDLQAQYSIYNNLAPDAIPLQLAALTADEVRTEAK